MRSGTVRRGILPALIVPLSAAYAAPAQQPAAAPPQRPRPAYQSSARSGRPAALDDAKRSRREVIYSFGARAARIDDSFTKARTLTDLADRLWEFDESYARQLFSLAYDELRLKKPTAAEERQKRQLISALVVKAAKHDPAAALYFSKSAGGIDQNVHLLAARAIAQSDAKQAVEYAEQTLDGEALRNVSGLLSTLRERNKAVADEFFLRLLSLAVEQRALDGETLMKLGTYVFTSPALSPNEGGYEMKSVGGVFVVNLSADRPEVSPEVTRAYLQAAITVLTRPTADPEQQRLYYIAGRQLLPRVRALLPSRAAELDGWMKTLGDTLPHELTRDSAYETLSAQSYQLNLDTATKGIDKLPNDSARDAACVSLAHAFSEAGKFADAAALADRVREPSLRSQLSNLISFRRAAAALADGQVERAKSEADALTPGITRGVLRLGVAHELLQKADKPGAVEAIDQALLDARSTADPRSPQLIIAAASILSGIDARSAVETLSEGVEALSQKGAGASPAAWSERVKAGAVVCEFSLLVKGVPLSFEDALPSLLAADFDGTVTRVMMIGTEQALAPALVGLATGTLKLSDRPPRPTQRKGRVLAASGK